MPTIHRILATTALCLAAVGLSSCQEIADGVCNVTGAKMPKDWVPSVPKKDISFSQPNGWQVRTTIYDLSKTEPFAEFCGQVVHFFPVLAIKRMDYAGGIDYTLIDHIPLPGGVINLYSMPVQKGKLLAVRGCRSEEAPEGSDSFSTTRCEVKALVEVLHPDASVNQGRPLYLVYNLGHEGTKEADDVYTNIKRSPWESTDTPETRSIVSLFEQINNTLEQGKNPTTEEQ